MIWCGLDSVHSWGSGAVWVICVFLVICGAMTMMMFIPVIPTIAGMLLLSPDRRLLPSSAPPIRFGMSARRRLSGRTAPRCGRRPPRPLRSFSGRVCDDDFGDGGVVDVDVVTLVFPGLHNGDLFPFPGLISVGVTMPLLLLYICSRCSLSV